MFQQQRLTAVENNRGVRRLSMETTGVKEVALEDSYCEEHGPSCARLFEGLI